MYICTYIHYIWGCTDSISEPMRVGQQPSGDSFCKLHVCDMAAETATANGSCWDLVDEIPDVEKYPCRYNTAAVISDAYEFGIST